MDNEIKSKNLYVRLNQYAEDWLKSVRPDYASMPHMWYQAFILVVFAAHLIKTDIFVEKEGKGEL